MPTDATVRYADAVRDTVDPFSDAAARVLDAAVRAADPYDATREALDELDSRSAVPVAVGKAAASMARAWTDAGGPPGLVVVPHDRDRPDLDGWEVRQGHHPVPDDRSYAAGRRVRTLVRQGLPVVLLLSGGASSLIEIPATDAKTHRELSRRLYDAGPPIATWNAARSLLSEIKAGGLAAAAEQAGTMLRVLYASDVPDDDPALVGSGPGVRVPLEDLHDRVRDLPADLRDAVLEAGRKGSVPSASAEHRLVLPRRAAADAAETEAVEAGLSPTIRCVDGPVDDAADRLAAAVPELSDGGIVLVWGEPTVRPGPDAGRGGRATHLLAATWARLDATATMATIATDGVDGASGAGGGVARLDPGRTGDARDAVARSDTATFLDALPEDIADLVPIHRADANAADVGAIVP